MKIRVENMSCMHCVQTIQKALLSNQLFAKIDLATKTVTFNNEVDGKKGIDVIKKAGFNPVV